MEQPTRNAVGVQIRRIRNAKNFSQQRLASLCSLVGYEITRSTLAKIEAALRAVSDVELFVIATALRVSLEDLYPPQFASLLKKGKIVPFHARKGTNKGDE